MKQLSKAQDTKWHSVRLTDEGFKILVKFARARDQSLTLTLDQIVKDYPRLITQAIAG